MRKKVVILSGGSSVERDVSLQSGEQIFLEINKERYSVCLIELTVLNEWKYVDGDNFFQDVSPEISFLEFLNTFNSKKVDVTFLALHGKDGEDGTIQAILDLLGISYVGSGVLASALAMDKYLASQVFEANGISTPKKVVINIEDSISSVIQNISNQIKTPFILKPNNLGSSIGIYLVTDENISDLEDVLVESFKISKDLLIEEYISGREFACGVLGSGNQLEVLPPIEIITNHSFFDYDAKYSLQTKEVCPPENITTSQFKKIQQIAELAHKVIGCRDLSRSDIILDNHNKLYLLEINTLPGMTKTSLFPKEFNATNRSFRELIDILINFALSRSNH